MRPLLLITLLLVLGCDGGAQSPADANAAREAPFSACALLSAAEWEALLGTAYHGPEANDSWSRGGGDYFTSSCTYNFTEITLARPAAARSADDLLDALEQSLQESAEIDAENGMLWTVQVEPVAGLGVPAVRGQVTDSENPDGLGVYYIRALTGDGDDRTQVEVKSAESPEEAAKVLERVLAKL
jgi:hypothetical protein